MFRCARHCKDPMHRHEYGLDSPEAGVPWRVIGTIAVAALLLGLLCFPNL